MGTREAKAFVWESWKHGRRAMGTPDGVSVEGRFPPGFGDVSEPVEGLKTGRLLVLGEIGEGDEGGEVGCGGGVVMYEVISLERMWY
jgi:hypothetical protein